MGYFTLYMHVHACMYVCFVCVCVSELCDIVGGAFASYYFEIHTISIAFQNARQILRPF